MPRPKRIRPVQQRSRDTTATLIDATARVLTAHGYAHLTTNHVAREAGVSVGTLYRYFADKAELVEAVRDRTATEITATLTAAMSASVSDNLEPVDGFRHLTATMVEAIETHRGVVRALLSEAPLGLYSNVFPEIEQTLGHFGRLLITIVRPDLTREQRESMVYIGMAVFATACFRIAIDPPPYIDKPWVIDQAARLLAPALTPG
ncbi:TetR/AcrR family transcriptional regulator [Nocardia uniformis]|nr:TetR/AcrR family transcriptional regulator [Nocardia uniformis]